MLTRTAASIILVSMITTLTAQDPIAARYGIELAPGERLVAIDGVPVASVGPPRTCPGGVCSVAPSSEVDRQVEASEAGKSGNPYVVNRDPRAFAHALREARILASRRSAGHPLGVAPGCRYSGTGYSHRLRPTHCYSHLPESRLIARAAVFAGGRWYWSAHYR